MPELCLIRAMVEVDLPMVLSWRNHEDVRRYMFTQHEITLEEHFNWFAVASVDAERRLLIVEDVSGPLGYVQLSHVEAGGIAHWGFYTRPDAPKGSGQKLGKMALDYAFGELKLHKICGQAIESNERSITFHKSMGFSQEAVLRDQVRIAGVYHNLICFGLLTHEWQPELNFSEMVRGKN